MSAMSLGPNIEVVTETPPLPKKSRRSPWLAVLLSLMIPGAGQLYCEKPQRGGITLAFSVLGLMVWITSESPGLKTWGLLLFLVVWIFSFLDAYFTAIEINSGCETAIEGRNPRVALTLSLLFPSCGYFYLGQHFKGIVAYVAFVTAARIEWPPILLLLAYILMAGDAYRIARGQVREAQDQERLKGHPIQRAPSLANFVPVGAIVYVSFIRAMRTIRVVRRGILRRLPQWASDVYDLLEYVNFLKLLPILIAVAFVPKHFFEKLPVITKGNSDPFLSPFKAMTTFASVAVIVSARIGWSVEYRWMLAGLIVSALSAPFWTMILIFLFYAIFRPKLWFRR